MTIYKVIDGDGLCWFSFDGEEPVFGILDYSPFIKDICLRMVKEKIKQIIFEIEDYSFWRYDNAIINQFRLVDYYPWAERGNIITAQKDNGLWIILDTDMQEFSNFDYIDGFDQGLTRVFRKHRIVLDWDSPKAENAIWGWGIIDTDGNWILPMSSNQKVWRFYEKALTGTTVERTDKWGNKYLYWFDFATQNLIPKEYILPENMYLKKAREKELLDEWWDIQEQNRIDQAYSEAEVAEARHSTSTGEEWDIDEWGNEYIPDWIDD